ncbi:DDE-type integrase/transposase/recombinase, partial [Listeria seeligeri]
MNLPKMSTTKPNFLYAKLKVSLACPNHLNQQFNPTKPNPVWTSDISYIPVNNGFVYLCVILDLYSRKVIAWKVRTRITTSLVLDRLQTASDKCKPAQLLLFHTDRGTQYTSSEIRQFLDHHSLTYSYSKKGYPWDNAVT